MTERIYSELDGVRRTLVYNDDNPKEFHVKTTQDVEPILDSVARDREIMRNNRDDCKLVARVPVSIYERSIHEQWDDADWNRWLNSFEAKPFRIWQGSV
jgi:hypothetical protein